MTGRRGCITGRFFGDWDLAADWAVLAKTALQLVLVGAEILRNPLKFRYLLDGLVERDDGADQGDVLRLFLYGM